MFNKGLLLWPEDGWRKGKPSPLTSLTTRHLSIIHTGNKRVLNIVERKRPISVIREVMKTSRATYKFSDKVSRAYCSDKVIVFF